MSDLARELELIEVDGPGVRRGPANTCSPLYGAGDMVAWDQVERLRAQGLTWGEVQHRVDEILGIDRPIPISKFIYHWRRRCFCWPEADRR